MDLITSLTRFRRISPMPEHRTYALKTNLPLQLLFELT